MMGSITLLRTQTDDRLVELVRAGHERAFDAIVERYRRPLLRAACKVLPEARAEDAVQQAFIAAWRALARGDEVRELRPWLHRIMRNTALNALRVHGYDHAELEESLRVRDLTQDEVERRAVVRETLTGLAALPERQREALLRTAVEGRSQAEVAEAMGLTDGAVRQLVHRARHSLRGAMTAATPMPVVTWLAAGGRRGSMTERVAELVAGAGGAGAAATMAKVGTVAVVAGGAVAGGGLIEKRTGDTPAAKAAEVRPDRDRDRDVRDATTETARAAAGAQATERATGGGTDGDGSRRTDGSDGSGSGGSDDADRREDSSGPGSGDDSSGSGSGGDDFDDDRIDNSGPGSVNSGRDHDSSGSGSGGDDATGDSSGPGSGDDDLVVLPEADDDNSGSGSGSSGSGADEPDPVEPAELDDSSGSGSGSDDDR